MSPIIDGACRSCRRGKECAYHPHSRLGICPASRTYWPVHKRETGHARSTTWPPRQPRGRSRPTSRSPEHVRDEGDRHPQPATRRLRSTSTASSSRRTGTSRASDFFQLHELFDTLAEGVLGFVDLIAERATALGGTALGTARMAAGASSLPEYPDDVVEGMDHVACLVDRYGRYAASTREAIKTTDESGRSDDGGSLHRDLARGRQAALLPGVPHPGVITISSSGWGEVDDLAVVLNCGDRASLPRPGPRQAANPPDAAPLATMRGRCCSSRRSRPSHRGRTRGHGGRRRRPGPRRRLRGSPPAGFRGTPQGDPVRAGIRARERQRRVRRAGLRQRRRGETARPSAGCPGARGEARPESRSTGLSRIQSAEKAPRRRKQDQTASGWPSPLSGIVSAAHRDDCDRAGYRRRHRQRCATGLRPGCRRLRGRGAGGRPPSPGRWPGGHLRRSPHRQRRSGGRQVRSRRYRRCWRRGGAGRLLRRRHERQPETSRRVRRSSISTRRSTSDVFWRVMVALIGDPGRGDHGPRQGSPTMLWTLRRGPESRRESVPKRA